MQAFPFVPLTPPQALSAALFALLVAAVLPVSALTGCKPPSTDPSDDKEVPAKTLADLTFSDVSWQDDGPEAREHGALMVADDGGTIFLLSGGGYPNAPSQEMLADAWRFDVASATWTPWAITGDVPTAAASRRVAMLPGNRAVLFGGYDEDFSSLDDAFLVELDSGVFSVLTQTNPRPLPRSLHAFGYDEPSDRLVVFGGFYGSPATQDILDDTWRGELLEDTGTVLWERVEGPRPAPRYGMFAGVEPGSRRFVVFSGAGFPTQADPVGALDDVWALSLDGAPAWTELTPEGTAPPGRRNGCGVVDPVTHAMFVFGGTADGRTTEPGAWLLDLADGARWSAATDTGVPAVRSSGFGAAWPGGGFVCGFGNSADVYRDLFFLR
jgi:hypothetical protein